MRLYRPVLIVSALSLIVGQACAQSNLPAPSTPLAGSEVAPCIQNGGYKACTTLETAQTLLSHTGTFTQAQTFTLSGSGAAVFPIIVQNTATYASGAAVGIYLYPSSASNQGAIEAYTDGSSSNVGVSLGITSGGTSKFPLLLSSNGELTVNQYLSGAGGYSPLWLSHWGFVVSGTSTFATGVQVASFGATGGLALTRAQGTPAAPTGLSAGNLLGPIEFDGYGSDSTLHRDMGDIVVSPATSTSGSDSTAYLCLRNTANGTAPPSNYQMCFEPASSASPSGDISINYNSGGHPSFKNDNLLGITQQDGHGATIDIVSFLGGNNVDSNIQLEAYGGTKASPTAVIANQGVGSIGFNAWNGTGDTEDAAIAGVTTQAQTNSNNGMGIQFATTPYNSTATAASMGLSMGTSAGNGGLTVGTSAFEASNDLGPGSINAQGDISTNGHFRGQGTAPAPSACGTSPTISGTDNAALVTNGTGTVTSCTLTFHTAYGTAPICVATMKGNTSILMDIASISTTQLVVNWASSYNGAWNYICEGNG